MDISFFHEDYHRIPSEFWEDFFRYMEKQDEDEEYYRVLMKPYNSVTVRGRKNMETDSGFDLGDDLIYIEGITIGFILQDSDSVELRSIKKKDEYPEYQPEDSVNKLPSCRELYDNLRNEEVPLTKPRRYRRRNPIPKIVHTCSVCGKSFNLLCRLNSHMISHSSDRPYSCECGKSFKTLKGHIKTHKDTRKITSYKCSFCDSLFKRKCHLSRHINLKH